MELNVALQNIENLINVAVKQGVFSSASDVMHMHESMGVIADLVIENKLLREQVGKGEKVTAKKTTSK